MRKTKQRKARAEAQARELEAKRKEACAIVEKMMRELGSDASVVIVSDTEVQADCLSWSGSLTEATLYEALTHAIEEARNAGCAICEQRLRGPTS